MNKITLALVGAGERGRNCYAPYVELHGYEAAFVAVAEADPARREQFRQTHGIDPSLCFHSAEALFQKPRLADGVLICTQDTQHYSHAVAAIRAGYRILVEKPISPDARECLKLARLAEENGTEILVCHVLRYTPFYRKLKEVLDSGAIGEVVSLTHAENVGYWHYSHSYVRGNWRSTALASPMILAKCCHDMDIIAWLLGKRCVSISSFGGLRYFREENAPGGAPARCLDGCAHWEDCPFYAPALYLSEDSDRKWSTARNVLGRDLERDDLIQALKTGPYGRCVFRCDNDVVDHQVASMLFEGGATATFTMCGFTNDNDRTMRMMGTRGEIRASLDRGEIQVTRFGAGVMTGPVSIIQVSHGSSGHSGGDDGLMAEFLAVLRGERPNTNPIGQSVHSHVMALAAEESRLTGQTVALVDFERRILSK